jgi:putative transposase
MARRPRVTPPGVAQHVIQRGNNRQLTFRCDDDRQLYGAWVCEYANRFDVHIHAWVFMANHVHLLVTPQQSTSLPMMMQSIGRHYVRYFNTRYERTGTLYEGRYRSCLVGDDRYLLACYRYIEMNPVRAGMVGRPRDYPWSSHRDNAFGEHSGTVQPHPAYQRLGLSPGKRRAAYRGLFTHGQNREELEEIRTATNQGLAFGSEKFKDEIQAGYNVSLRPGLGGRPKTLP